MGVLFYLRSDEQYILVGDAVMAVFLFISMLCDVVSIGTSHNILINKKHSHDSGTKQYILSI
jgi:hypothetical protein